MLIDNNEYLELLNGIKQKIYSAQYKATLAAYVEMTRLYWEIGSDINSKRGWGKEFVRNLARDIRIEFPMAQGYSERNLRYMAKFARTFSSLDLIEKILGRITWYHNQALMDKSSGTEDYLWYAAETVKHSWTRDVMVHMVESGLYQRQVLAEKVTNYKLRLPAPQSDLAVQTMKDPYIFDFIPFRGEIDERTIEDKLVSDITKVLLEFGSGFAYVGRQYHLTVDDEDFYIDLLFYNLKLRCYVVIELKAKSFKPEYAGKLNFYISAVDDMLRTELDNPTIGLLLCKSKKNTVVEYALKDLNKPIGVSHYELGKPLPQEFVNVLPSADEIKTRIGMLEGLTINKGEPLTKPEQRVLDLLKSDGTLTVESIADLIGRKTRAVHDTLRSLRNRGVITRVGGNKNGRWVVIQDI